MVQLVAQPDAPAVLTGLERFRRAMSAELEPLLEAHYREVAHYPDIPLDIDWDRYEQLQVMGRLRLYTMRRGGDLVGYVVFFVGPNAHYKGSLQANQDVLYLDPSLRRAGAVVELLEFAHEDLRLAGVQVVYQHLKVAHDHPKLMAALGYTAMDTIYARRLDQWQE